MMHFLGLTRRNALIAAHDALATAVALVGSFYIRFEGNFADRLPLLLNILPYFIVFSLFVCYFCRLTTSKWRFISLPDALNILRAATVLALTLLVGRAADAEILLRGIESGAVKRIWPAGLLSPSPADLGQLIRNIPVLGGIDELEHVIADFAKRNKPI